LVVFGKPSDPLIEACKKYEIALWEYDVLIEEERRTMGEDSQFIDHN
jgi:hypothetical protein